VRDSKTKRFRAAHDRSELLQVAQAVLKEAAASAIGCRADEVMSFELLDVSQSGFDRMRAAAGYPMAPPARELCRRTKLSWEKVKRHVAEDRDFPLALAQAHVRKRDRKHDPAAVVPGLIAVARRLGISPTAAAVPPTGARMSADAYAREREQMLSEDRRRRHGGALFLPTINQITEAVGEWGEALELAGLPTTEWRSGCRGLSVAEALDLCFEQHGVLPTQKELMNTWREAQGLPISRQQQSWPEILSEFRARWQARGVVVPDSPPPQDQRPDYTLKCPALPELPPTHQRKHRRSHAELVEAVAAHLDELPAGEEPGRASYTRWSEGRSDVPSYATLTRKSNWRTLIAEARELRRRRQDE
jgi:hypothetical protein